MAAHPKQRPAEGLTFPWPSPPDPGAMREILSGLLWLRLRLPYRLDHVNIYLLAEEGGFAAVDAGLGDAETRAAWEAVLAGPLAGERLTRLIVTHFHPDHVGLAGWLCERHGIPLYMPRTEYLFSFGLQYAPPDRGEAMYRRFYRQHGLPEPVIDRVLSNGHEYLSRTTGVPTSYHRLQQGRALRLGEREFDVLTGGGHSLEQAMFHCPRDRLFLAADQVIAQISPNVSVYAMEPGADALGAYLASLRAIREEVPDDVLVLPGHGLPFRGLHARVRALMAHHATRCAIIAESCRDAPRSAAELIAPVFPRELDAHQTGFAFGEVLAHVNHMVREGRLREVADGPVRRYVAADGG